MLLAYEVLVEAKTWQGEKVTTVLYSGRVRIGINWKWALQELPGLLPVFLNVGENVSFRAINKNLSFPCSPLHPLAHFRSLGTGPMCILKAPQVTWMSTES